MQVADPFLLSWSITVFGCYLALAITVFALLLCSSRSNATTMTIAWTCGILALGGAFGFRWNKVSKEMAVCAFIHIRLCEHSFTHIFGHAFSAINCRHIMFHPQHAAATKFPSACASAVSMNCSSAQTHPSLLTCSNSTLSRATLCLIPPS